MSKSAGLEGAVFYGLYFFTILCSLGFAYYFSHYDMANDYLVYNRHGWEEYKLLKKDPLVFFTNITDSYYADPYGNFFDAGGSFWNDLRNNLIIKMIAIFNLISLGNFYINTLFFSLIAFTGKLALYKFFKNVHPNRRWSLIIGCFLLPSACLFLSGIHKDAVVFFALAFFSLHLFFLFTARFRLRRLFIVCFLFLTILILRNYVAFALMPVIAAWFLSLKIKSKPIYVFLGIYFLLFLGIVLMEMVVPEFQPLKIISDRQREFLSLPLSNTQLQMDTLQPTVKSFLQTAPSAMNHAFLQPTPFAFNHFYLSFYAIENGIYVLLFVLFLLFPCKTEQNNPYSSANLFCIFLALSMFLFIGYSIPAVGAIIRYKSLYLPFIITALLAGIDWKRLRMNRG